jgi:hypothetical protein
VQSVVDGMDALRGLRDAPAADVWATIEKLRADGGPVPEPGPLKRLLDQALIDARRCSSDPLCAEHVPQPPSDTLHAAACHACLFAAETSCETNNRWLDRAVVVNLTAHAHRRDLDLHDGPVGRRGGRGAVQGVDRGDDARPLLVGQRDRLLRTVAMASHLAVAGAWPGRQGAANRLVGPMARGEVGLGREGEER